MNKYLIYGLYCPFTDNLHYVGKSSSGMTRPRFHMSGASSEKINEWVSQLKFLGYKPEIRILEECQEDNLDEKERFWIKKFKNDGAYLLNIIHNKTEKIVSQKEYKFMDTDPSKIGRMIKEYRTKNNIRQEDLCKMAEITRPTLYMIEKGNNKMIFENIKKVLDILGFEIIIQKKP